MWRMHTTDAEPSTAPEHPLSRGSTAACLACLYALVWLAAYEPSLHGGVAAVASLVLAAALIAASAIDVESYRLPDAITLPLALAGVVLGPLLGWSMLLHALAAAAGYLTIVCLASLYRAARGRDGIGMGDAKLLAASAAWLGPESIATVLLIAALSALGIVGAVALFGHRYGSTDALPFGPFIAFATWMVWTHGPI